MPKHYPTNLITYECRVCKNAQFSGCTLSYIQSAKMAHPIHSTFQLPIDKCPFGGLSDAKWGYTITEIKEVGGDSNNG